MGQGESKEEEKDWAEFTQNRQYQQNLAGTYANRNEAQYQEGQQPRYARDLNGDNIQKENKEINQVKLNFN